MRLTLHVRHPAPECAQVLKRSMLLLFFDSSFAVVSLSGLSAFFLLRSSYSQVCTLASPALHSPCAHPVVAAAAAAHATIVADDHACVRPASIVL
jgi:hypothetical protein